MSVTRRSFIKGSVGSIALAGLASVLPACTKSDVAKSGLKFTDFESKGTATIDCGLQNTFTSNVPTKLIAITNKNGLEVCITNLGARIVSFMVPDKNGNFRDIELGLSNIKDYADVDNKNNVFGAAVGPVIGRISNAEFFLNGINYHLDKNCKDTDTLHSGKYGWQYQTWTIKDVKANSVSLNLQCPDMESGFPGDRDATVSYTLTDENSLQIDYYVTTNIATPINIANHSYFNLEGNPESQIFDNQLQIFSNKIVEIGNNVTPTGKFTSIEKESILDFNSKAKNINKNIDLNKDPFKFTKGYDFAYIFDNEMTTKATLYSPVSGIFMEVITDRPIINFYDTHDLDQSIVGKNNIAYNSCCAVCLEAQGYADDVHHLNFPSNIISPNNPFKSTTIYKFSVR